MRNPFVHGIGGVLSADIAVPEHDRELAFYASILTTGAAPLWRDDLLNNKGTPIIGLGPRSPEYSALPLQWMPHFQVADVAASAASAIESGGQELMHGKDATGQSQWAVLADPDGAAFGLIPVVPDAPATTQPNEHIGHITWLSLNVPDASSSRDFYQRVIGWMATAGETGQQQGESFEMRIDNETAVAEICPVSEIPETVPSVWLIHLPVADLAQSLQAVGAGGGEVLWEFPDQQGAVIRDPVGACLALQAI